MHLSHIRTCELKHHFRGGLRLNCYQVADVTLSYGGAIMTILKTRRVVKSEIRAAFIKVLGAIKWRKNLHRNLLTLLSAACSMQHEGKKHCF